MLVLCTGKCTKQIEELQTHTKEYTATLQLGATTASYDKEHSVNHTFPTKHITRELVEETLQAVCGEIQQVPPTYSAVKVNGDRSYALRRAEDVQSKPKTVRVDEIELTDYNETSKTAAACQFAVRELTSVPWHVTSVVPWIVVHYTSPSQYQGRKFCG